MLFLERRSKAVEAGDLPTSFDIASKSEIQTRRSKLRYPGRYLCNTRIYLDTRFFTLHFLSRRDRARHLQDLLHRSHNISMLLRDILDFITRRYPRSYTMHRHLCVQVPCAHPDIHVSLEAPRSAEISLFSAAVITAPSVYKRHGCRKTVPTEPSPAAILLQL